MYIIQKDPNPSGAYPPMQSWDDAIPPEGYALIPDDLDTTPFYAHNGFVTLTMEDSTVTAMEPNLPVWEEWKASLPPEVPPAPSAAEQLRADVDYIAVMAGVSL